MSIRPHFFPSVVKDIYEEIANLRIPCIQKRKRNLSIDLALVGVSLRTAYLVDSFAISDPVSFWDNLLKRLRSNPLTQAYFSPVIHIFEPSSEQSFIVNVPLLALRAKCGHSRKLTDEDERLPVFVKICSQGYYLLDSVPVPLRQLVIEDISAQLTVLQSASPFPVTLTLPAISPALSVPLAAILLDYSVAYVPDSDSNLASSAADSLSGVPMDFYECVLGFRDLEEQDKIRGHLYSKKIRSKQPQDNQEQGCTIMKFSCPAILSNIHHELKSDRIIEQLNALSTQRLQSIGDPSLLRVTVYKTTHTLDRLAF